MSEKINPIQNFRVRDITLTLPENFDPETSPLRHLTWFQMAHAQAGETRFGVVDDQVILYHQVKNFDRATYISGIASAGVPFEGNARAFLTVSSNGSITASLQNLGLSGGEPYAITENGGEWHTDAPSAPGGNYSYSYSTIQRLGTDWSPAATSGTGSLSSSVGFSNTNLAPGFDKRWTINFTIWHTASGSIPNVSATLDLFGNLDGI